MRHSRTQFLLSSSLSISSTVAHPFLCFFNLSGLHYHLFVECILIFSSELFFSFDLLLVFCFWSIFVKYEQNFVSNQSLIKRQKIKQRNRFFILVFLENLKKAWKIKLIFSSFIQNKLNRAKPKPVNLKWFSV